MQREKYVKHDFLVREKKPCEPHARLPGKGYPYQIEICPTQLVRFFHELPVFLETCGGPRIHIAVKYFVRIFSEPLHEDFVARIFSVINPEETDFHKESRRCSITGECPLA
jgi:hypothetical protein